MTGRGFWATLLGTVARNPISFFAVLCVATAAWLLYIITDRLLDVLESPKWCANAIQAEKISPGSTFKGLDSCLALLKMQLSAMGTGFHIALSAFSFSLIVLVVVVLAGARAKGKAPGGFEFDVSSKDDQAAAEGAKQTAAAAVAEAKEIATNGPGDAP
jgi:hypothetical protein